MSEKVSFDEVKKYFKKHTKVWSDNFNKSYDSSNDNYRILDVGLIEFAKQMNIKTQTIKAESDDKFASELSKNSYLFFDIVSKYFLEDCGNNDYDGRLMYIKEYNIFHKGDSHGLFLYSKNSSLFVYKNGNDDFLFSDILPVSLSEHYTEGKKNKKIYNIMKDGKIETAKIFTNNPTEERQKHITYQKSLEKFIKNLIKTRCMLKGAITFIDFLGWKGFWINELKDPEYECLDSVSELVKDIKKNALRETEKIFIHNGNYLTRVISISDTIAIFTIETLKIDETTLLKLHADIASSILDEAAKKGYALRGAINKDVFRLEHNIMLGAGVDECAMWYEKVDWLGVIFTPSSQFIIEDKERNDKHYLTNTKIEKYDNIPLKGVQKGVKYCVNWGQSEEILNEPLKRTVSLLPDIAIKYINTQKYLNSIRKAPQTKRINRKLRCLKRLIHRRK